MWTLIVFTGYLLPILLFFAIILQADTGFFSALASPLSFFAAWAMIVDSLYQKVAILSKVDYREPSAFTLLPITNKVFLEEGTFHEKQN